MTPVIMTPNALLLSLLCLHHTCFIAGFSYGNGKSFLSLRHIQNQNKDTFRNKNLWKIFIAKDVNYEDTLMNEEENKKNNVPLKGSKEYQNELNYQLKRNLVQETIYAYKNELLSELCRGKSDDEDMSPFDASVKDKLTSLIQVNPVSTTTDSNFLEGEWELAYIAPSAAEVIHAKPSRLEVGKSKIYRKAVTSDSAIVIRKRDKIKIALSGFISSTSRVITLESLEEDEEPYLVDVLRIINGLFQVKKEYRINNLTRRSLEISSVGSKRICFGPLSYISKRVDQQRSQSCGIIENLYLDNDLCISMGSLGEKGPLYVYTKSENWTNADVRVRRKIRKFLGLVALIQSPFRLRNRYGAISRVLERKVEDKDIDKMVAEKNTSTSKLKVVKLGETGLEFDETKKTEESWESEDDPFVHLDAVSRQEVLKSMSIKEINDAAERQRKDRKNDRKRRRKQFKPPLDI